MWTFNYQRHVILFEIQKIAQKKIILMKFVWIFNISMISVIII